MKMKKQLKKLLALLLVFLLLFTTGCGGGKGKDETSAEPLKEINQIPEDGIITKEQFKTIAGESKKIQFTEETTDSITYTWTFNAGLIKNPQDQNLKVTFGNNVLETVKAKAADAVNALKLNMGDKALIVPGSLAVTIPELWESSSASLVKEENNAFTDVAEVTVTKDDANKTTTLTMDLVSMDESLYIIGKADGSANGEADSITSSDDAAADNSINEKAETTTVKKEETATTKKEETTTSKKPDTTTSKKEETTTAKKEETTTAKKEETTTAKKEETTEAPKLTCTISISCKTILDNMDKLDPAKKSFVPSNGWILKKTTVTFEEGESVHDVLKRVCKKKGIHMESSYTPIYDSAYIEGINQIYEFDCGSESGWMYKVNGWFPNYGCSQYKVSDGDNIAWVYTCDLGTDVGDNSMQ